MGGGDIIEAMVFDFLMDPQKASLSEISSEIDQSLRASVERDRFSSDRDADEQSDTDFVEDEHGSESSGGRRYLPVRQWIYDQTQRLSDQAGRFGRVLQRFVAREQPYPAVILGEDVCPVDIDHRLYRSYRTTDTRRASTPFETRELSVVLVTPSAAANHFAKKYASFVHALASATQKMPANYPSHLHYTIKSVRSGFRVHSTPLYWMSPTVFGDKRTSPVSGYLTPGLYRFGGDHPNNSDGIRWDSGQHTVSPTTKSSSVTVF